MSTTTTMQQRSALDPWTPPDDDVTWFADPAKRANYARLLEAHNERDYADAVDFYLAWRAEIDADARGAESAA
ncbi:MAG TPA: hypothetical protein VNF73_00390 [Candidatus Saccharimonadales bacterium]|nr:hypothetical protein [Candidatus Saccharimonadales bacterium]